MKTWLGVNYTKSHGFPGRATTFRIGIFSDRRLVPSMTAVGVRRGKAALSSGCKSHPATAPAGSNRSSHGGNEVAEASGVDLHYPDDLVI